MSKAAIAILHRVDKDAGQSFGPATSTPALVLAYSYITELPLLEDSPHEECFRLNNCVDGTEFNAQNKKRSLSVGDVVMVVSVDTGTTFWQVNGCGWQKVTDDYVSDAIGVGGGADGGKPNFWQKNDAGFLWGNVLPAEAVN
jgi:hypothetical protein